MSLYHAEAIGLLVIAMGLVFFGALTRRTVFDIGKKEIRREICFITTDSIQPQQIRGYHTTAVSTRGDISSYVFGLKYGSKGNGLMKGIAAFKDLEDLQRFQGVVTRMLSEMNDIPQ